MPREHRSGEPDVTAALVRALLADQHPDLAWLPVAGDADPAAGVVRGWDNTMVRLGDRLAVRLPRHEAAEALLDREVAWLPVLGARTGLGLPAPVRTGVPAAGYPYRWAVVPWVAGTPAVHRPAAERDAYAGALAAGLRRLHVPAPPGAPANPFRGMPLASARERYAARWADLVPDLDPVVVRAAGVAWHDALAAPVHAGPPAWLHGDPHPDNTVLTDAAAGDPATAAAAGPGAPAGPPRPVLVDFGDLCAGDPASDLGIALTHFTPAGAAAFRARYDASRPADEALWRRARGWAIVVATILAVQPPEDALHAVGRDYLATLRP
ncbi:phosphotransferase [Citricoccus sp. SGAir0253]|uniref:phosphotransferase n=1 Tax=Citricoccus sp. SGAir0253 TaxID=2567881 RepID=UPI0010CD5D19|nr:phosphotransferase [Citricoccus sp. SGAir0253]QCU78582.1 phosphotransferase [Citricoccus sp. SGAir0253]